MRSDAVLVADQIERAVRTLRMIPPVRMKSGMSTWPDFIREFWEAYGWNETAQAKLVPTARQITELDQVIGWLAELGDGEMAKIIWARSAGASWRKISKVSGLNHETCRYKFRLGICSIAHRNQNFIKKD